MTTKTINFSLSQPQADFLALKCRFPAFIAGFGSGKSYTMGVSAFIDASQSSDALIAIYEPDHSLIRTVAMPAVERCLIDHGIRYVKNKTEKTISTSNNQFGDFMFRSLDNPELIVGFESYTSHIDELDVLPQEKALEAWNKIIGRNRQQPEGIINPFNKISAYSTPEGYKFMYKMWGTNSNSDYQAIRASSLSNPVVNEAFIQTMRDTYPPALLEAYLEGHFVNMKAATVYANYNRVTHDSNERIERNDTLYIGCDFNVGNTSATIYVRREGGHKWHAVQELTGMKDTPAMIDIIESNWKSKGHHIVMYPDASGAARKTVNASSSDISLLKQAGFEVRAHPKNPDVRDRVAATNKAFSDYKLFINSRTCPTVARCLEQQAYDKNGAPDKAGGQDHQNDATTYPIAYELSIKRPMFAINIDFARKF